MINTLENLGRATRLPSLGFGKYIYAIGPGPEERLYECSGIDAAPVFSVSDGAISAVVSNCERRKIRPERAHLAAHQEVLRRLMLDHTVLPMAFGIIAEDLKSIRKMLVVNHAEFLEQLERVAGKVEMGLRVVWDVPNIFEYFIDRHPELRAARDKLVGHNREPSHAEKLELGQFFEELLEEDRETHFAALEEALRPCSAAIKRSPPRQVNEVMNLNILVERNRQAELDTAILAAAKLFDNNYAFDINGPWAPHNFVEMNLEFSPAGNLRRSNDTYR